MSRINKVTLITGASRGIGKEMAHYFASKGYDLALVATNEELLEQVKSSLQEKYQIQVQIYALDVTNDEQVLDMVSQVTQQFGRIDVLFNNAGVYMLGTSEIDIKNFRRMMDVNVMGACHIAMLVARQMKKQKSGYIFNVASMAAKRGLAKTGGYSASKYSLAGMSESLFKELLPFGVKVTALCPSAIETDMTQDFDMPNEEKIRVSDISTSVDYLLNLSPTAAVNELQILCPYITQKGI